MQVGFAFNRIESALSYLVNHLARFSGLAAQTERLDALFAGVCRKLTLPKILFAHFYACLWLAHRSSFHICFLKCFGWTVSIILDKLHPLSCSKRALLCLRLLHHAAYLH